MSMKTSDSPRRIYTRNGFTVVCFNGKMFGPQTESAISTEHPVTCELMESDGGRARVKVTQSRKGVKTVTETWRSVKVPVKSRAA